MADKGAPSAIAPGAEVRAEATAVLMQAPRDEVDNKLVAAWRLAATDLGFRLHAPYLLDAEDGDGLWVEGFLPDFGGGRGMIIRGLDRSAPRTDLYVSLISEAYRDYDRARFIEAMADWGWHGPTGERPEWLPQNGF